MSHERLPGLRPELASLLKRFGIGPAARSDWPAALCIVATFVNLPQIEHAYGPMFATTVRHVVRERARELCRQYPGTVAMSAQHILFVFDASPDMQDTHRGFGAHPSLLLDRILTCLADRPVRSGSAVAFPVIEVNVAHFADEPFDIDSVNAARVSEMQSGEEWREQFLADTQVAERVFRAMDERQLDFDFERICDAKEPWTTHYHEALLSKTGESPDKRCRIGSEVRALERLGVVRRLDRWVVESIIGRLRANPDARMGCNVSAASATIDAWWAVLIVTLFEEPEVASRLTIEITETFPLANLDAAREFVSVIKWLGCRVALDDVGHDFGSLRNLVSLGVDIVKLDRSLVVACRHDETAAARLIQLIGFAKVCDASVVVEGIETTDDARIACANGATGLQGYLYFPYVNKVESR
ncbi:UNVERIFIED_ORG: EAL domain-containing protein (putative c-di-GMP-specific phosphodiesterase class I) [Paraburkholderia sediminicola]|uniref:EAL domain-containing protein n=1 Tax=Paraburkholderia sp. GAS82 TaxID=3035137 RepID=UPI0021135B8C|nr:EAL domain-containing protein (putative c-di-GMP-specific phosphodiesterase class I) [Paraburkholderia sediminicola]